MGLRPRGDPLPLGEFVPAALGAEPAAVSGSPGAAKRRVRVVVQRLVVDVHDVLRHRSVAALAARWGFFDTAHFSRVFRQYHGYPPSQVRSGIS